jgi:hypothetical protein
MVVEGLPSIAGDAFGSAAGGVKLLTEISSVTPSLSTWKLNSPKAMSKPLVTAEVGLVEPETDPMTAVVAWSTTSPEAVVGSTSSMLSMGQAFLMVVSMMVLTAHGALSMAMLMANDALLMAVSMAVVGEGAGESVDPDPVVPMDGAN